MPVFFQSLRSGSSGNCLALWNGTTSVLIDCGLRSQRACRALLDEHQGHHGRVDAVLVSHSHIDHVSEPSLRVLEREGIRIHGHHSVLAQVEGRYGLGELSAQWLVRPFSDGHLQIGDFSITPVPVPHTPGIPNYGFVIKVPRRGGSVKIAVFTDFFDVSGLTDHFTDADFVFLEANHDRDLLREHPNPNSHYHLSNRKAARLLCEVTGRSAVVPSAVMLGHLSHERNRPHLALAEVETRFGKSGVSLRCELLTAPRHNPSPIIRIG